MRIFLISIYAFFHFSLFGQSKIISLSEMFSSFSSGGSNIVVVTDTNGITTSYDIPHAINDLSAHDKAFNEIMNGVISMDFELVSAEPVVWSDFIGMKPVTLRTWFFRKAE